MNDNHPSMIEAMLASPDSGDYMPPHLASRRDSSPRPGESDPVVTQGSSAAHPMCQSVE